MNQLEVNTHLWRTEDHVHDYAERRISPVEATILLRYREALGGRVLDAGCGAGRILGYLLELGGEVHGIDVSEGMVQYCRETYPAADVQVGDVRQLAEAIAEPLDAILAPNNLIDVFDDHSRRSVLGEFNRCLVDGGLLVFSSHNLQELTEAPEPLAHDARLARWRARAGELARRPPAELAKTVLHLPTAIRNHRRLAPLQRATREYAIVNDETFDYGLLHYYVHRKAQERQLDEAGFDLLECLDAEARRLGPDETSRSPWLHYVARRRPASAARR